MRNYAPLTADHPMVKDKMVCPGCGQAFQEGDITTLVCIGPGDDEEARARANAGRPYNAVAVPVHAECADPN